MHCLIITILCCVDDHFTLWFTVNFVVSYVQYLRKTVCRVYQIGYQYQLLFSNKYWISENIKIDIGTSPGDILDRCSQHRGASLRMHALVQSILYNQYLIIYEHYMLVNKMCVVSYCCVCF